MVGKVYAPPNIDRRAPKERAGPGQQAQGVSSKPGAQFKPSAAPKSVVPSNHEARHPIGPFKPVDAPAPAPVVSKPSASVVPRAALPSDAKPKPEAAKGASNAAPASAPILSPVPAPELPAAPGKSAATPSKTSLAINKQDGLSRELLNRIFTEVLDSRKATETRAERRAVWKNLAAVDKKTRELVQHKAGCLMVDTLDPLIRLHELGMTPYPEDVRVQVGLPLPISNLSERPPWIKCLDFRQTGYGFISEDHQEYFFWNMLTSLKSGPELEYLALLDCKISSPQMFGELGRLFDAAPGQGFSKLKTLVSVGGVSLRESPPLQDLFKNCPALETLEARFDSSGSHLSPIRDMRSLKKLELHFKELSSAFLDDVFPNRQGAMNSVEEFGCKNIDYEHLLLNLGKHFPKLKSLILRGDHRGFDHLRMGASVLEGNEHLSTVTIFEGCVLEAGFKILAGLPKLDTLRMPELSQHKIAESVKALLRTPLAGKLKVLQLPWKMLPADTLDTLRRDLPKCKLEGLPDGPRDGTH